MAANRIDLDVVKLVSDTVIDSDNLDVMATQTTQLLVGALGIKGATLFILNPEREALEILASSGLSTDYVNKGPILVDQSITLASNREAVVVSDATASDRLQYPEKAASEGIRAIVSFPIHAREKIIGALRLYHSEVWEISGAESDHLQVLCQQLGLALMYFRLATSIRSLRDTINEIHPIWL
jgi:GAF domain-containing protein